MTAVNYLPIKSLSFLQSFVQFTPTRTVTDGVLAATTTVTSATAAFTSSDVGAAISGGTIPANATISSVTNGTTVVISAAATGSASGVTLTITRTSALAAGVLNTALTSAYAASAGTIQCFADSQVTGNALVVANDVTVLSVAPTNWVGWNGGQWSQYTPAQLTANFVQYFTS
jgi:hypothetical protein